MGRVSWRDGVLLTLGAVGLAAAGCTVEPNEPADEALGTVEQGVVCTTIARPLGTVADTSLVVDPADPTRASTNYGAGATFSLGTVGSGQRSGLVRFDVASKVPTGSTVHSATLSLRKALGVGPTLLTLHDVTAPWSEGTVTYSSFGGAFSPAALTSFDLAPVAPNTSAAIDVTSIAQGWVNGGTNNGLYLDVSGGGRVTFGTSETGVASSRPQLTICFVAPAPSCIDGVQNGGETGVDCGGPCAACPTCSDGLQNGGETGVDCGGPTCAACPSCSDGVQNAQETGIDCGGSCIACPTCSDGLLNGQESGVDCGGPTCPACYTCNDGLQNGQETGVDCGGPLCAPCATCSDGLQNGQETGLDCGGPSCAACCVPQAETCNGVDDDCDGAVDEGNPGGGTSCATGLLGVCGAGTTTCAGGSVVCAANVSPASEQCNGYDDDCNGVIDDGGTQTFYYDADGDGFGNVSQPLVACAAPPGYVAGASSCTNGSLSDCNVPGTTLIPSSAYVDPSPPSGWTQCAGFVNTQGNDVSASFFDNCLNSTSLRIKVLDANGALEEDISVTGMSAPSSWPNWNYLGGNAVFTKKTYWGSTTFFTTTDGKDACAQYSAPSGNTFGTGNGSVAIVAGGNADGNEYRLSCGGAALPGRMIAIYVQGPSAPPTDCDDADPSQYPGAAEACNGADDNCDGQSDEGNPQGGGACASGQPGACNTGVVTCQYGALTCTPASPTSESCNGVDDDCDGVVDDNTGPTYWQDADGDGYGNPNVSVQACSPPAGYVSATGPCKNGSLTDCNVAGTTLISSSAYVDPAPPAGWTQCAGFVNTAGNDVAANFFDNCLNSTSLRVRVVGTNGSIEEDVYATGMTSWASWPNWNYLGGSATFVTKTNWGSTTFFTTTDGKDACAQASASSGNTLGTGNGSVGIIAGGNSDASEYRLSCGGASLSGRKIAIFVQSGGGATPADCNDGAATAHPGAAELCNGADDDCDAAVDEGNPQGGGSCSTGQVGNCGSGTYQCQGGALSCVPSSPISETCNGVDDDCDGQIDEGAGPTWWQDADGDGFGNQNVTTQACSKPAGYVSSAGLCKNGSSTDCNVAGTTLISSSAYVDTAPPAGWVQCAGFINTAGNDVAHNFFDNCLNSTTLRIKVLDANGNLEEDVYATGMTSWAAWPNWNYLSGSATFVKKTYWGSTTFFTTTDGKDACAQASASSGNTLGTGNGSVGIVAGGNSDASEYRVSCGGASLSGRKVAIYVQSASGGAQPDCNDASAAAYPGAAELCNGADDNCNGSVDEGNPQGGASCASGQLGVCATGTTTCSNGALVCAAPTPVSEVCINGLDEDCDGVADDGCPSVTCSNGSGTNCNWPNTTLISSSVYVDPNPPAGWTQCAGFINTSGDDVAANFFDYCLNTTKLRLKVLDANGALEEDVYVTNLTSWAAWPNWNYLGGSPTAAKKTYWGSTTFFTTTDGKDACAQASAPSGNTFGTGNGSVGIIAGGNTNANEYRVSCGGASLSGRKIALYK